MASTQSNEPRVASTAEIRSQFPALERTHNGCAVAYFDGPGGTQVPRAVADAITDYLYHHNANAHWAFPTSQETDEVLADARSAVGDFLNAAAAEVAFGPNMTTLTFHAARALGRGWGPGDEVVVTELDHQANVAPWETLVREREVTLRVVKMDPDQGVLDGDDLRRAINGRTKLVAIGAASNALGTINDIAAAAGLAHEVGAKLFVDAVHFAAHGLVDVRAWDCDFLVCSACKFYGPHVGVFYGKGDLLQSVDVPKLRPALNYAPDRWETGTQNHEGIAGTAAAVNFLADLAPGDARRDRLKRTFAELHVRGLAQVEKLWTGLSVIRGVRLFGLPPGRPRTPTLSFAVEGIPAKRVAEGLAARGLFLSHGDFYATTVIERLGYAATGLVRIGCSCYTTDEEIDRLLSAVRAISEAI